MKTSKSPPVPSDHPEAVQIFWFLCVPRCEGRDALSEAHLLLAGSKGDRVGMWSVMVDCC